VSGMGSAIGRPGRSEDISDLNGGAHSLRGRVAPPPERRCQACRAD
jgi:hypothetical protein